MRHREKPAAGMKSTPFFFFFPSDWPFQREIIDARGYIFFPPYVRRIPPYQSGDLSPDLLAEVRKLIFFDNAVLEEQHERLLKVREGVFIFQVPA